MWGDRKKSFYIVLLANAKEAREHPEDEEHLELVTLQLADFIRRFCDYEKYKEYALTLTPLDEIPPNYGVDLFNTMAAFLDEGAKENGLPILRI